MRRVLVPVCDASVRSLLLSKRFARRRRMNGNSNERAEQEYHKQQLLSGEFNDIDSLASTSPVPERGTSSSIDMKTVTVPEAAPPTSLDKIRVHLAAIRNTSQLSTLASKPKSDAVEFSIEPASKRRDFLNKVYKEFQQLNKPNDVYRFGKEVVEGEEQRTFLMRKKLFNDTDEVLRKGGNREDTLRYMKLVFPSMVYHSSDKILGLIDHLLQRYTEEREKCKQQLCALSPSFEEEMTLHSGADFSRLVWMGVMDSLSDDDIRMLWSCNIIDVDTLESLLVANPAASTEDGEEDSSSSASLFIEEKLRYLQRLHYLKELTSIICETELNGMPSIDLAPVLAKVERHRYEDITEKELRLLEQYEEKAAFRFSSKASPDRSNIAGSASAASNPRELSTSFLNHAMAPSNTFLYAIAQKDEKLRRSLETLERIKRETLLDPGFQDAVQFAHAEEEASVAPHFNGMSTGALSAMGSADESAEDSTLSGKSREAQGKLVQLGRVQGRAQRSHLLRGPMARSAYAPEDIPYFYNSVRSIVPPRGAFNLPNPAPTKQERMWSRGQRRKQHRRSRYSK